MIPQEVFYCTVLRAAENQLTGKKIQYRIQYSILETLHPSKKCQRRTGKSTFQGITTFWKTSNKGLLAREIFYSLKEAQVWVTLMDFFR